MFSGFRFRENRGMASNNPILSARPGLVKTIQLSVCIASLVYFSGCASTGYKQADAASKSLHEAGIRIQDESRAIDAVLVSLDNLVDQPSTDLRPQYKHFSGSLDRLVAASKRAEKAAAEADRKSQEYFQSWDKQTASIKYEVVRDESVSRKTQVSNDFNTVNQRYRENQAVIQPLISYLQDIRTALGTDLTGGGVQSVRNLAANAQQNARKVQLALARLSDELADSGARMSSRLPRQTEARGGTAEPVEQDQDRAQSTP